MLTKDELAIVMPLIDSGIKAVGLQVFRDNGGTHLQSALAKLQLMAERQGENDVRDTPLPDAGLTD